MELVDTSKRNRDEELNINQPYDVSSQSSSVASEDLLVWTKDESDRENQFLFPSPPDSTSNTLDHIKQPQIDPPGYSRINRLLNSPSESCSYLMNSPSYSNDGQIYQFPLNQFNNQADENRNSHVVDDFIDLDIRPVIAVESGPDDSDRLKSDTSNCVSNNTATEYRSNDVFENGFMHFDQSDMQYLHCDEEYNNPACVLQNSDLNFQQSYSNQNAYPSSSNWPHLNSEFTQTCRHPVMDSNRDSIALFSSNLSTSSTSSVCSVSCIHLGNSPTLMSSHYYEKEESEACLTDNRCVKPSVQQNQLTQLGSNSFNNQSITDHSIVTSHNHSQQQQQQWAVMLIPISELATGDSLTCTVVNILRGLNLLDRCGVEDLCASLYEFWNNCSSLQCASDAMMYSICEPTRVEDILVTRSSSFTSYDLVPPRLATLSQRNIYQNSRILTTATNNSKTNKFIQDNCLVNYLLACSYAGTSFLVPSSICDSDDQLRSVHHHHPHNQHHRHYHHNQHHCCFKPLLLNWRKFVNNDTSMDTSIYQSKLVHSSRSNRTSLICNPIIDWRKGCADNLVFVLTQQQNNHHHHSNSEHSSVMIHKLLTGRFLPGPSTWRSVWPTNHHRHYHQHNQKQQYKTIMKQGVNSNNNNNDTASELAAWFSAWISCGCVPVLAQLLDCSDEQQNNNSNGGNIDIDVQCVKPPPQELSWCHRLVCGVTETNEVYLTNPNELVPITYVVEQLTKQTKIFINKSQIYNLWSMHHAHQSKSTLDNDEQTKPNLMHSSPSALPFFSSEGLSLLAQHSDPRWVSMNIMGQVLCILRNLERWAAGRVEKSTSSSVVSQPVYLNGNNLNENNKTSNSNTVRSSHSIELEQISTSPAIVIPSAQLPGISLFVAKSDKDLVRSLFQTTDPLE